MRSQCRRHVAHRLPKGAYDFGMAREVSQSEEFKALRAFADDRKK
jgi:hypothetical protein